MHSLTISLLLFLLPLAEGQGKRQSVAVKGRLTCDGKPIGGVKLKLYDVDFGPLDDLLDQKVSAADGSFSLSGSTFEATHIDPKLNIYHDCDDFLPCQRRISLFIPLSYISTGPSLRVYDAGSLELGGSWEGETRDCLHRH